MKHKMDLQLFADAIQGKKMVYMYRIKDDTSAASMIPFVTENERSKSKDADSTATKDGAVRTPGVAETEITGTSLLSVGDTMLAKLEEAMDEDSKIEVWEINLAEKGTDENAGKYKAKYFEGYLTEFTVTSDAEDHVEVATTIGIDGNGEDGYATVTEEQEAVAAYTFKDTTATTE